MNAENLEEKFYTVLCLSHIDSGSESILRLITNNDKNLINSNTVFKYNDSISFKLFDLTIPKSEQEYEANELFENLVEVFKGIRNGVDIILISFPINFVRLDAFWIRQVFRILKINSKDNILALITNLDLINEEARSELLKNKPKDLSETLIKNMVIIKPHDIKNFEERTFKNIIENKLEYISKNKFLSHKIECAEKFYKIYKTDKIDAKALLKLTSQDESFFNFVQDYKKFEFYLNNNFSKQLSDDVCKPCECNKKFILNFIKIKNLITNKLPYKSLLLILIAVMIHKYRFNIYEYYKKFVNYMLDLYNN